MPVVSTLPALALLPSALAMVLIVVSRHRPAVREMWRDWDEMTRATVAGLRAQTGADQSDPGFAALITEVSEASPAFARLWAQHDVKPKGSGRSVLMHPSAGELDLAFEKLAIPPFTSGQLVVIYHAEPGSPSEARLSRLAE